MYPCCWFFTFALIWINCYALLEDKDAKLTIDTANGKVQGFTGKTEGLKKDFYAFLGIPFAEPPIGELRFAPPVPKKNWTGVWNATKYGNYCLQDQINVSGDEDCLFINVFTPELPSEISNPLPVMVWVYGGAFFGGFSDMNDTQPDYLLEQDVIVVSFNYRLGILGFLSTGDMVVPGNNGLKDQILALKWVQENIAYFGGNPKNVTIFGQSAGSASISYLLQAPLTKGLYQRAILQSGVSLCLWSLSRICPKVAKLVATDLGVNTSTSQSLVEGLRKVKADKLQNHYRAVVAAQYLYINPRNGFHVAPVIEPDHEGAVISNKSYELLRNGQFNRVPIIIGQTSLEATFNILGIMRPYVLQYDLDPGRLTPIDMNLNQGTTLYVGLKIKFNYFGLGLVALANNQILHFISDDQFNRPIQNFVRLYSRYAPAFYYVFSYQGGLWGIKNRTTPGVGHEEDLGYIFKSHYNGTMLDNVVRRKMVKLWTNFAKTGNPTPDEHCPVLQDIKWTSNNPSLPFSKNLHLLEIGKILKTTLSNPATDNMQFWDHLYESYGKPPYDTY